ncbi:MAG: hypothetical protein AB7N71_05580 [Phycisphaerae bacterium]
MQFGRLRLWVAGLVAFIVGVPLSERAFAQTFDIIRSAFSLGLSIADSAGDS